MKYYRTKDGRIIKESDIPDYWGGLVAAVGLDLDYKAADNLEELFDEYVMENKEHTYQTLLQSVGDIIPLYEGIVKDVKDEGTGSCEKYLQNGWEIYGAVIARGMHGEPILKPVAKMKIDGGWELL